MSPSKSAEGRIMRFPRDVDVVIIGAGHAGLAMSRFLSAAALDHVVLERGEIANSWRHERWDSLRLLTPNWQSRLPGYRYKTDDPHGYMTMPEVIDFIRRFAGMFSAPVREHTQVTSVAARDDGYLVVTNRGSWKCRAVVMAGGANNLASVPEAAKSLPPAVRSLTPKEYRNPEQLDPGGVLIVGASATGVQLADEIQRSGRQVMLAVGEHIRLPRTYRGRDIVWWMDALGVLDERFDQTDDIVRARRVPSPQLVGSPQHLTLDLNALTARGVEIVGRLGGISAGRAQFSGSLRNHCTMADLKLARLLNRIDKWVEQNGSAGEVDDAEVYAPTRVDARPRLHLDFAGSVSTVIWATGYRPDYHWLHVPVFDHKGRLRHEGGVVDAPGLYTLGLNFMRRRKSSFIHGTEDDVREIGAHLNAFLRHSARAHFRHALARCAEA